MAATARITLAAALGTLTDTANTLSDTVKTVGLGVGMVNAFVSNASIDQRERQVAHRATYRSSLINEASMEIARQGKEVLDFMSESPENATLFNDAKADLDKAFAAFDNPTSRK